MRVRWTARSSLFVATSVDVTQSLVDSSWRRNKINASSRNGTLFVATNVDAKTMQRNALCSVNSRTFRGAGTSVARVRWMANRYSASSRDGALRKHEPGWGGRQRNALLQHDFAHFSWPWNKRSASSLDGALRKRDRGWTAVFAVCGGVLRMRTTDSERGPSWYHLGAI